MRTLILLLIATPLFAIDPLYIYRDDRSPQNNFSPSGWIGDYGDISLDTRSKDAHSGTAIKITYKPKVGQGVGWAGIYWLDAPNNWGKKAGRSLDGYRRLTFWAKGERDSEGRYPFIAEFKVGGVEGEYGDSGNVGMGPVTLTGEWKQYTLDLDGIDLSQIIGGFCVSWAQEYNAYGMTFYLDDVVYE